VDPWHGSPMASYRLHFLHISFPGGLELSLASTIKFKSKQFGIH
jgi:hypothetical protein